MKFVIHTVLFFCLLGYVLSVGIDVDHCSQKGTLFRMDIENACNDCCCVKKGGRVDYTPSCKPKSSCAIPSRGEWTKMKKVIPDKICS